MPKTFVRITNEEVYEELRDLKEDLEQFRTDNRAQHNHIMALLGAHRAQVKRSWLAISGIGILSFSTLGWLINHLI